MKHSSNLNLVQTSTSTWQTTNELRCTKCKRAVQEVIEFGDEGMFCYGCLHGATAEALMNNPTILMRDLRTINFHDKAKTKQAERKKMNSSLRYKILKRDGFKCQACGVTSQESKMHVDHIKSISNGGKTVDENLQALCEQCNLGKGDRHDG